MSYQSEGEQDKAFNSLSDHQKKVYFLRYRKNKGDVEDALNFVLGPVWFNKDGTPIAAKKEAAI